jgi:hypothetical protein
MLPCPPPDLLTSPRCPPHVSLINTKAILCGYGLRCRRQTKDPNETCAHTLAGTRADLCLQVTARTLHPYSSEAYIILCTFGEPDSEDRPTLRRYRSSVKRSSSPSPSHVGESTLYGPGCPAPDGDNTVAESRYTPPWNQLLCGSLDRLHLLLWGLCNSIRLVLYDTTSHSLRTYTSVFCEFSKTALWKRWWKLIKRSCNVTLEDRCMKRWWEQHPPLFHRARILDPVGK